MNYAELQQLINSNDNIKFSDLNIDFGKLKYGEEMPLADQKEILKAIVVGGCGSMLEL